MLREYELYPVHSNVKSFYGKAKVRDNGDIADLFSYDTLVCSIQKDPFRGNTVQLNKSIKPELLFSQTTLRHIKEFLQQYNMKAETKEQIIKDYMK
jgi:hypothetical protein